MPANKMPSALELLTYATIDKYTYIYIYHSPITGRSITLVLGPEKWRRPAITTGSPKLIRIALQQTKPR